LGFGSARNSSDTNIRSSISPVLPSHWLIGDCIADLRRSGDIAEIADMDKYIGTAARWTYKAESFVRLPCCENSVCWDHVMNFQAMPNEAAGKGRLLVER